MDVRIECIRRYIKQKYNEDAEILNKSSGISSTQSDFKINIEKCIEIEYKDRSFLILDSYELKRIFSLIDGIYNNITKECCVCYDMECLYVSCKNCSITVCSTCKVKMFIRNKSLLHQTAQKFKVITPENMGLIMDSIKTPCPQCRSDME